MGKECKTGRGRVKGTDYTPPKHHLSRNDSTTFCHVADTWMHCLVLKKIKIRAEHME